MRPFVETNSVTCLEFQESFDFFFFFLNLETQYASKARHQNYWMIGMQELGPWAVDQIKLCLNISPLGFFLLLFPNKNWHALLMTDTEFKTLNCCPWLIMQHEGGSPFFVICCSCRTYFASEWSVPCWERISLKINHKSNLRDKVKGSRILQMTCGAATIRHKFDPELTFV